MTVSNLTSPRTPAADFALARRLETADAALNAGFPERVDDVAMVAGGTAVFCGVNSPLTQAIAVGMNGPVTGAEVDRMEEFFRIRGSAVAIDLCPYADSSLIEALAGRGYQISEFTNKLIRQVTSIEPSDGPHVRIASDEAAWSRTLARGFFERDEVSALELQIFEMMFRGSTALISEIEGQPAGGGAFAVHEGIALFFSDATVPEARGKGIQPAVVRARLALAAEKGCDLAMASTTPGSLSQRNYERFGFQVVYTRVLVVRTAFSN
jgi:GNAT superfamily N-acetyltransferase